MAAHWMYNYSADLNKQMIYESATDVQLIMLILNKQIIYGSLIDVQL